MKYYIILLFLSLSLTTFAQQVTKDGKTYEVKKEKIFLDGNDVTATLNLEEKTAILTEAGVISEKLKLEKEQKEKEEKEQKDAEKELKKKEKLQSNFDKAEKNLEKNQKKYDKLKRKGKLSPQDNSKWQNKLDKLATNVAKAKRKL